MAKASGAIRRQRNERRITGGRTRKAFVTAYEGD